MKKNFILLLVSSVITIFANDARGVAFDFLNINLDARSTGLGGVSTLLKGPGSSHIRNAALAAAYSKDNYTLMYSSFIGGVNIGGAAGAIGLKNGLFITPSFRYYSIGSITSINENGDTTGVEINPFSLDANIGLSYYFSRVLSVGGNLHTAYEHLTPQISNLTEEVSATALLLDAGFLFTPTRAVSLSGGARNLGWFLKRFDESDNSDLPISMYSGVRYQSRGITKVNIMLELEKMIYSPLLFNPAMEFIFKKDLISLRIGTNFSSNDISHFFNTISGTTTQPYEYTKSNAQVLALGLGIKVPVNKNKIFLDMSSNFMNNGIGAVFIFSGGFSF